MAKGQRGHPNTPSDLRKGQRGQRGHSPTSPGVSPLSLCHQNRRGHPNTPSVPFLEALLRCPDCNAEVTVSPSPLGILRAEVRHDATCPTFRAMGDAS